MIERKPSRSKAVLTEALATGAERYSVFRRHVPLEGPLKASALAAVASATGLNERQARRLAVRFRANPVATTGAFRGIPPRYFLCWNVRGPRPYRPRPMANP